MEAWIERVRDTLPPRPGGPEVRIKGPDVDACAKGLVFLVTWHFRQPPLPDSHWNELLFQNCPGVQCELVPLYAFLNPRRSFRVYVLFFFHIT